MTLGLEYPNTIMFTGLVQATGAVLNQEQRGGSRRIAISAPGIALHPGDSIAVSGVCLTAVDIDSERQSFHADLSEETVSRTSLTHLLTGSIVNLELPTPAGAPLGGHVVQGHVDGVGKLLALDPADKNADRATVDWRLSVAVPTEISRYMVEKGSVAIEGISLTIARLPSGSNAIEISIIPHTYAHTNLHTLRPGELLNIETDILLKFMEQRRTASGFEVTPEYLIANGY
jgi:riboflavin synthase